MSVEPAVLDFLKHIPTLHAFDENITSSLQCNRGSLTTTMPPGERGDKDAIRAPSVSPLPYTLTPMVSVTEQSWEQNEVENKLLTTAKHYAVKVSSI